MTRSINLPVCGSASEIVAPAAGAPSSYDATPASFAAGAAAAKCVHIAHSTKEHAEVTKEVLMKVASGELARHPAAPNQLGRSSACCLPLQAATKGWDCARAMYG